MLNDIDFFGCAVQQNMAIRDSKEIFGENTPYTIENRFDGKIVVFDDHFIRCVRETLTTGCMAKMNAAEELLMADFVNYQNGDRYRDITRSTSDVMVALDEWMVNLVYCNQNPIVNDCYSDTPHTWDECAI